MKKILILALATLMLLFTCGCKSKEQQRLEELQRGVEQAEDAARSARKSYNDLQNSLNSIQNQQNRLNGAS